jgi:hypothetical protein
VSDDPKREPPPLTPPAGVPPYDQPVVDPGPGGQPGYQPYPGAVPPGYPPPGPPPKKSNRGAWTIVLIVVGSLLALCCIGGGVAGFFIYRAARQVVPANDATRAFIRDLESGDASDAYDKLCPTTKASFPEPVFASIVASEPQITGYDITGSNVETVNGRESASVTATLNRATGAQDQHTFLLRRESGKWLVCGQPY